MPDSAAEYVDGIGLRMSWIGAGSREDVRLMSAWRVGIFLCAVIAAAPFSAQAREEGIVMPGEERLSLRLGAFMSAFDTRLRVDGRTERLARGTTVDLKNDLGVDPDKSATWGALEWRFAPRHRVGLSYTRFALDGGRRIERELRIGDRIYPVDALVSARFRLEVIPLTYSYSLLKRRKSELALTVGLHWGRSGFAARASSSIVDGEGSGAVDAEADMPLPLIGLRYAHHFSPRWSAGVGAGYFSVELGDDVLDYRGSVLSARGHVEYRISRRFGVGGAVEGFRLKVDANRDSWRGRLDYGYVGSQLYVTARF